MKKRLFFAVALTMAILTVAGCKKEPPVENKPPQEQEGEGEKEEDPKPEQPEQPDKPDQPEPPVLENICSEMDDEVFISFCLSNFDTDRDGRISVEEAAAVNEIKCNVQPESFKGIEHFTNLEVFTASFNTKVKKIDLSLNTKITSIPESAFEECSQLTEFVFPPNVTSIGEYAFSYCVNLGSISLPSQLTEIGGRAFLGDEGLKSITIPESVTSIGDAAFSSCPAIEGFYGKFASADNRCLIVNKRLIAFAPVGCTTYDIPAEVTEIGECAFCACGKLTSLTIHGDVTEIGQAAFASCQELTEITIPDKVATLGNSAFFQCIKLTKVSIGKNLASIPELAFYACISLKEVRFADGNAITSIGQSAFANCLLLGIFNQPVSVVTIGQRAFENCICLPSYEIKKNVTSVGAYAFSQCATLTSVICYGVPPTLGENAFVGTGIKTPTVFYISEDHYDEYLVADGWKDLADKFVAISGLIEPPTDY